MSKCYSTRQNFVKRQNNKKRNNKRRAIVRKPKQKQVRTKRSSGQWLEKKEVSSMICAEQTHCFRRFRRSNAKQLSSKKHRNRLNYVQANHGPESLVGHGRGRKRATKNYGAAFYFGCDVALLVTTRWTKKKNKIGDNPLQTPFLMALLR